MARSDAAELRFAAMVLRKAGCEAVARSVERVANRAESQAAEIERLRARTAEVERSLGAVLKDATLVEYEHEPAEYVVGTDPIMRAKAIMLTEGAARGGEGE